MTPEIFALLALGMANGLVHALDADHILAVSAVALNGQKVRARVLRTAAMWAVGHGASLTVIILLAVGLGLAIPEELSRSAEILVGIILIAAGGAIVTGLLGGKISITRHSHGDLLPHTHIHKPGHSRQSDHRPVLVGLVHGVAGSAPLLAVLPLVIREQFVFVTLYIALFSLCVGVMMCLFGGGLGVLVNVLGRYTRNGVRWLQGILGLQAIGIGGYWLYLAI